MKTLLVLTLLIALVGLGVWNSPKAEDTYGDMIPWVKYTPDVVKTGEEIRDELVADKILGATNDEMLDAMTIAGVPHDPQNPWPAYREWMFK